MRSQIVGASPLLSHQQLAHSFLLWRPVQTCKSLCFITLTAPCRHELPHALRKQAGVGRYRMFKDLLEEVSRGGKERKELPQQLGLLSGIMSVDGYGCPRCENQLCFGWKVDLFLPGGRCAGGSRSRASRCTDRCALAASSQRSNNRACGVRRICRSRKLRRILLRRSQGCERQRETGPPKNRRWKDDWKRPVPVNNLARLSKGKMIGVRYNMDKDWVGGSVAYFEK